VVKEIDTEPRWKHMVGMAQELLSLRVLRITEGQTLNPRPLDAIIEVLAAQHWPAEQRALHRGYHFPHSVLVSSRPAQRDAQGDLVAAADLGEEQPPLGQAWKRPQPLEVSQ
jgi:hypothetical protein